MVSNFVRRPRAVPIVVGVVLVALAFAGVAAADVEVGVPQFQTQAIDARGGTVVADVTKTGPTNPDALQVKVAGKPVEATVQSLADAGSTCHVVVVIDNSSGMGNGPVQLAKAATSAFAPGTGCVADMAVVTTGAGAKLAVPTTRSAASVQDSLKPIGPGGGNALWDGIVRASDTLQNRRITGRHVVVVAGTADSASWRKYPKVEQALRNSGSSLHVMALGGGTADLASLRTLVGSTGGTYQEGTSNDLAAMGAAIGDQLSHQFRISFPAPDVGDDTGLVALEMEWAGAENVVSFRPNAVNIGATALAPVGDGSSLIDRLTTSELAKWLIVLLGTASAGMIVYSIAMLITRRSDGLSFALRHYDGYTQEDVDAYDDEMMPSITGNNQILQRAVAVTGQLAQRQGGLVKVEELLERADLPLRPAEALFFYAAGVAVAGIGAALLSGDFLVLLLVVLVALLAPNFFVKFRASRRRKKFVAQLPDMLQLLAGTLRAGYSIAQGFEAVSGEIDDPMGRELRRVMAEARLGRPIEDALDGAAERTQSEDFGWAVMAIRIQREVGGNLAELLMTVSDTMTQRERLRREVAALTAEGRMSAIVLGCLPPGLAAVMWVMNPEYIGRLTEESLGLILLGVAAAAMIAGFAWMKKIITIEI